MVAVTQGRLGSRRGYTFTWVGDEMRRKVAEAVLRDVESFAALLEGYLRANLHRDSGDMADQAYVEVDTQGATILIRAGSDSDHTFWHEVKYHPQLRQAFDIWAPKLAATVRAAIRRAA